MSSGSGDMYAIMRQKDIMGIFNVEGGLQY